MDDASYTLRPPIQQQLQQQRRWYKVTGTVERNRAAAGVRFQLVKLLQQGLYCQGKGFDDAFQVTLHPSDTEKRLIELSIVFCELNEAQAYIKAVDSYINSTPELTYFDGSWFEVTEIDPFDKPELVLESHYKANKADGEAPNDSPVWDVEVSSVDVSSIPTCYSKSGTVYKFQRIETDNAFGRCSPQGAHIFPKARCKGVYEWLDKQQFNRLALSLDAHQQFDGSARGRGTSVETIPQVTLEPVQVLSNDLHVNGARVNRIEVRLWLRREEMMNSWRPFLPDNIGIHKSDGFIYFAPLHLECESGRRCELQIEAQENPDGTTEAVWVTAIPGVKDPRELRSFDDKHNTVAVIEIMFCLLKWSYNETRNLWETIP